MKQASGFSLVELIVVISLLSIIGGIAVEVIIKTFRNNDQVQAESLVHRDLSNALDRFTRVVRSSTELLEATEINLRIRGYPTASDTVPSEISFFISPTGAVKYSVISPTGTAPNYTYNPASAKEYLLMGKVTNSTADPLFAYYDESNTQLAYPVNVASIKAIEIDLDALDTGNLLSKSINANTTVHLRNFKTNL